MTLSTSFIDSLYIFVILMKYAFCKKNDIDIHFSDSYQQILVHLEQMSWIEVFSSFSTAQCFPLSAPLYLSESVHLLSAGSVVCQGRNATEDKVLLGCNDGTLVLYDEVKKVTQMTTAALVFTHLLMIQNTNVTGTLILNPILSLLPHAKKYRENDMGPRTKSPENLLSP